MNQPTTHEFNIPPEMAMKIAQAFATKMSKDIGKALIMTANPKFTDDLINTILVSQQRTQAYIDKLAEIRYEISLAGSSKIPHYVILIEDLVKGMTQIDMIFDDPESAKNYAAKKGWLLKEENDPAVSTSMKI